MPGDLAAFNGLYDTNPNVRAVIDMYGSSQESNILYAGADTMAFVKAIFRNVLGREPKEAGLVYWSDRIDHGGMNKARAALSIMVGALGNTTEQGLADAALIRNRIRFAARFTNTVNDIHTSKFYRGERAAATARAALGEVLGTTQSTEVDSGVERLAMALSLAYRDNFSPIAHAGPDQAVTLGSHVMFDARASTDPEQDSLTNYRWSLEERPAASSAVLSGDAGPAPHLVPDVPGVYRLSLTVSDFSRVSDLARMSVTVSEPVPHFASLAVTSLNANAASVYAFESYNKSSPFAFNFWQACDADVAALMCMPSMAENSLGGSRMSGGGAAFSLEQNVNAATVPLSLYTQATVDTASPSAAQREVIYSAIDPSKRDALAPGRAIGTSYSRVAQVYATRSAPTGYAGYAAFAFSSHHNKTGVPPGWSIDTETLVDITLVATYHDKDGNPRLFSKRIHTHRWTGPFTDTIWLPKSLATHPDVPSDQATYTVMWRQRHVMTRQ